MGRPSPRTLDRRSRPGASGFGRCSSCWAPGRAPARRRFGLRRRSSSFTWPRSSRRRARRGAPAPRQAHGGGAVGAEPGAGRRGPPVLARVRGARGATGARGRWSSCRGPRSRSPSASWPSGATPSTADLGGALPQRCELKTGAPVRVRLPDRAQDGRGAGGRHGIRPAQVRSRDRPRLPAARRRARCHGRRSEPERPAGPTCWTAPSPCR